ncbi:hypothetical protein KXV84_004412 [Aspergillus fumigatus]|nr:hypothetical protein KXW86_003146 [Aspergillus fumigatus]KAH2154443.1 hypothetical protein KXW33_009382 [Aspergillus fumigatus]KAH2707870.1 hypothetical protein KXW03_009116 [Aspergillus fumigatus]KAH2736462.1 hypothetical protein KXW77_000905 [Aspergillus fumigatus]KAH2988214.1 hypothetical protein KXV25_000227 [Aspergillus fumigatus]
MIPTSGKPSIIFRQTPAITLIRAQDLPRYIPQRYSAINDPVFIAFGLAHRGSYPRFFLLLWPTISIPMVSFCNTWTYLKRLHIFLTDFFWLFQQILFLLGQAILRIWRPYHFVIIGVVIGGIYTSNVETVEMTGRRRFNCVSSHQELRMGQQSYEEVLRSTRGKILPENHPLTIMVNGVLRRLIPQAPIEGADWRVHVIKDDGMVNAFVLPGGKVFVYTGILPICKDEDGLAAVLGHEIAHVVAHHPAERMSNNILKVGAVLLISMLFDISGQIPSLLLNLMYSLPNSRTQEAEADNIGLMMMSKACFNPEAAVGLWARMQKAEQEAPPQFLSTHPSSYNRMEAIRGWLGKAEAIYEDNGCSTLGNYMPGFRQASNDYYRW